MTEQVEFKNLPYFDRHVDHAQMHNAASEAVIQLQGMVHKLEARVAELEGAAKPAPKTGARAKTTTDK